MLLLTKIVVIAMWVTVQNTVGLCSRKITNRRNALNELIKNIKCTIYVIIYNSVPNRLKLIEKYVVIIHRWREKLKPK